MRLAKLSEFRTLFYTPGSAPCLKTLRAQIGEIPGGTVMQGHYYVDLDKFDEATRLRGALEARHRQLAADPLLEGLV